MEPPVRAGDLLKQARLKQQLTLSDCAHRTHIAQRYMEALENNRWADLPSESHRQGFLSLYARFLGLPETEIMTLYKREKNPISETTAAGDAPAPETPHTRKSSGKPTFLPSGGQWVGILIALLVTLWASYHWVKSHWGESQPIVWAHPHLRLTEPRLVVSHSVIRAQKIKIHADADTWMRVTTEKKLLFEGILPAQAEKEWTATSPFRIKISNVNTLHITWNDQPVDILNGAHGSMNTLQIPPR